jgi:hypothetical protein
MTNREIIELFQKGEVVWIPRHLSLDNPLDDSPMIGVKFKVPQGMDFGMGHSLETTAGAVFISKLVQGAFTAALKDMEGMETFRKFKANL